MLIAITMGIISCSHNGFKSNVDNSENVKNVLFLHHSTGSKIYNGLKKNEVSDVQKWFDDFNKASGHKVNFFETAFPSAKKMKLFGYGWKNYPYDYYNIWVKNGHKSTYKGEPTLKVLTPIWDVIIYKHCFPVSSIDEGGDPDVNSDKKTIENYKLQYKALKNKLYEYPDTKFIVWTGAALTEKRTNEESAKRAKEFFKWVKEEWDTPDDNIYIWDFYDLETEGGLYLKDEYAHSSINSHPKNEFAERVAPLFCQRIVDVIENEGKNTNLKGEKF